MQKGLVGGAESPQGTLGQPGETLAMSTMTGGGEEELLAKRDDKEDVLASGGAEQSLLHNLTGRVASADQLVTAPPVINIEPVLDNNTEYGAQRYVLGLKNKYQV
jgi:hypothetical protein